MLFHEHLKGTLIRDGFVPNPYDVCVFNKTVGEHQCTVTVYVDDLKISSKNERDVVETIETLRKVYKEITVKEGKIMTYLGMDLIFKDEGRVEIGMTGLINDVLECFQSTGIGGKVPSGPDLFENKEDKSKELEKQDREKFHSLTAKLLYIAKRARPDLLTTVSYLTTRVRAPNEEDMKKLRKLIEYLRNTKDEKLTLGSDEAEISQLRVFVDASHAVHKDAKSHTGLMATFGFGAILFRSSKQKVVTKSSTAAELVAVTDSLDHVTWAQKFLKAQGLEMRPIVLFQDNKSAILLHEKGKQNNKRTRYLDIRYFSVKDLVERGEIEIHYVGTNDMVADYFTKPLSGELFRKNKAAIMGTAMAIVQKVQGSVDVGD